MYFINKEWNIQCKSSARTILKPRRPLTPDFWLLAVALPSQIFNKPEHLSWAQQDCGIQGFWPHPKMCQLSSHLYHLPFFVRGYLWWTGFGDCQDFRAPLWAVRFLEGPVWSISLLPWVSPAALPQLISPQYSTHGIGSPVQSSGASGREGPTPLVWPLWPFPILPGTRDSGLHHRDSLPSALYRSSVHISSWHLIILI